VQEGFRQGYLLDVVSSAVKRNTRHYLARHSM